MAFSLPHVLVIVGGVLVLLALALQVTGLSTTGWMVSTVNDIDFGSGLFKVCATVRSIRACKDIPNFDFIQACRAFGVMSFLALGSACLELLFLLFVPSGIKSSMNLLAIVSSAAGSSFSLIEWAVYLGKVKPEEGVTSYGYSFDITVLAFALSGIAAVLLLFGRNRSRGTYESI